MEIRFLYTSLTSIKKAVTKTGYPLPNINHYITTSGNSYGECLLKAMNEAKFNESQLLGSNYGKHLETHYQYQNNLNQSF